MGICTSLRPYLYRFLQDSHFAGWIAQCFTFRWWHRFERERPDGRYLGKPIFVQGTRHANPRFKHYVCISGLPDCAIMSMLFGAILFVSFAVVSPRFLYVRFVIHWMRELPWQGNFVCVSLQLCVMCPYHSGEIDLVRGWITHSSRFFLVCVFACLLALFLCLGLYVLFAGVN